MTALQHMLLPSLACSLTLSSPGSFCCGAGTSADCENVTEMMSSQLTLHRLNTGRECRVTTAVTMLAQYLFRHQGHISAALVVGGVDITGPSLFTVHPHGSVDQLPFVTMGSGSLCAMAVYEAGYQDVSRPPEALPAAAICR